MPIKSFHLTRLERRGRKARGTTPLYGVAIHASRAAEALSRELS